MKSNRFLTLFAAFFFVSGIMFAGCSGCSTEEDAAMEEMEEMEHMDVADETPDEGDMAEAPTSMDAAGGSAAAAAAAASDAGDASGGMLDRFDEFDQVLNGAHLTLRFNEEANAFYGQVMNMGTATLEDVQITLNLSNGTTIGPTDPVTLVNGQSVELALEGPEEAFVSWNATVDVGSDSN